MPFIHPSRTGEWFFKECPSPYLGSYSFRWVGRSTLSPGELTQTLISCSGREEPQGDPAAEKQCLGNHPTPVNTCTEHRPVSSKCPQLR